MERDGERAGELIEQARAEIEDVRENEIRSLSHLLHSAIIPIGLLPALRSLISRYRDGFEIQMEAAPGICTQGNGESRRIAC